MKKPRGFTRYMNLSRSFFKSPQKIMQFTNAVIEYAQNKKNLIKDFRANLQTLINLLKDWSKGTYTGISKEAVLLIIAALLYFLSPIDTIPDFLGLIGFTDDASVILFVLNSIRGEANRYRQWCEGKKKHN